MDLQLRYIVLYVYIYVFYIQRRFRIMLFRIMFFALMKQDIQLLT